MNRIASGVLGAALVVGGCRGLPPTCTAGVQPNDDGVWLAPQQVREGEIRSVPVALREIVVGGTIAPDDRRVARVFSPVTGHVSRIFAAAGTHVRAGDPLVAIRAEAEDVLDDVNRAEADLIAAQHEVARKRELNESMRDVQVAQARYDQAKAAAERTRQGLRQSPDGGANVVAEDHVILAPVDGEVLTLNARVGLSVRGTLPGNGSVELFNIGGFDQLWVFADLLPDDLARVREGAAVTVVVAAYPGEAFVGKVDWISDALDISTRTARIRCAISNPDRKLRPETYATLRIADPGSSTPEIPRSAVVRLAGQTVVFVEVGAAPDGRLEFVPRIVTLGEGRSTDVAQVGGALGPRDRIVIAGAGFLAGVATAHRLQRCTM